MDMNWSRRMDLELNKRKVKHCKASVFSILHTPPAIECVSPEVRQCEMSDTSARSIFSLCITAFLSLKASYCVKWTVTCGNLFLCQ